MQRDRLEMRRRLAAAAAVLAALLLARPGAAQLINGNMLPNPRLSVITPAGGKAGSTVEVTFAGTDLEEPDGLYFSHAGIKAVPVLPPASAPASDKKDAKKPAAPMKTPPKPAITRFQVTIAADVPPGNHDVRLVNKWGVSNPRVFVVGRLDELMEKEPNNDVDQAQRVALGITVNGVISAPTDVDYFVFAAKKGQRVVVSCLGPSIDSKINPELKIYDASGREVASRRPRPEDDAVVSFTVPADGDYVTRLCQFTYTQGGPEFFYRLSFSTGPWIDAIFPPAVEPGKTTAVTLYGHNLPGSQPAGAPGRRLEQLTVPVAAPADPPSLQRLHYRGHVPPEAALVDGFEYRLRTPGGESNNVLLSLAQAPLVLAKGDNTAADRAQKVTVPCELAGQIAARRQRHWYAFHARKGEVYTIEMLSHRLGAPTDMFFVLRSAANPKQKVDITRQDDDPLDLGKNQLYTPSRDPPLYRFVVPVDGTYELAVGSHLAATQFGPEHVYCVRLTPERPDFRLVVMPADENRPDTCVLGQGGNAHLMVFVWRHDGFKGDIALTVEGLPTGVVCKPQVATPGLKHILLVLSADAGAPIYTGEIKVKGMALIGGQALAREARPFSITWPVQPQQNIPTIARMDHGLMLAVRGQAPLKLAAGLDRATVSHGDKLTIPLKLTRLWPEFKSQFQVAGVPQDLPLGMNFGALNFTPGNDEQKVVMSVPSNVPMGTYNFVFRGFAAIPFSKDSQAKQKSVNVVQPSTPVLVTVLPRQVAQLSVSNGNPTVKAGKQTEIVVRVSRQNEYADAFKVKLLLPPGVQGVSADEVTLPAGQNEVKLLLRAHATASPGNRGNLTIEASALVNGTVPLKHETKINVNVVK
jgi:Bacterial pre-peptidase C-terminal domain